MLKIEFIILPPHLPPCPLSPHIGPSRDSPASKLRSIFTPNRTFGPRPCRDPFSPPPRPIRIRRARPPSPPSCRRPSSTIPCTAPAPCDGRSAAPPRPFAAGHRSSRTTIDVATPPCCIYLLLYSSALFVCQ